MPVDVNTIEPSTVTRVVQGIRLPYTRSVYRIGSSIPTSTESGEVFVDAETLVSLAEQGKYDSQFGDALLLGLNEGAALEEAGLAVSETKGGFHGTDACRALVKRLGWL